MSELSQQSERAPVTIRCAPCGGTGSIESSDSTDDRWWDCSSCQGSGTRTIPDRRAPDPDVERLREALRMYGIHAETCPRHRLFPECTCGLDALTGERSS